MDQERIDNRLAANFANMGIPTCLRPFIGNNYSNGPLIITSSLYLNKNATLSTGSTPFQLYEDPSLFYSGITLSELQMDEIDVSKLAEDVNKELEKSKLLSKSSIYKLGSAKSLIGSATVGLGIITGGFLGGIAALSANSIISAVADLTDVAKKMSKPELNSNNFSKIVEDISNPLKKAGSSVNDIAIHRYYLRPHVFSSQQSNNEFENNYYTEIDHKKSIIILKNVIEALWPKSIIFSSNELAKQIAQDYEREFGESFEDFMQSMDIRSDLNFTWDVCQEQIIKILKDNDSTGQKRLRQLSQALSLAVDEIRLLPQEIKKGSVQQINEPTFKKTLDQLDNSITKLYAISDSIRLLVEEYKDRLKNRGTGTRNLTEEQRERRREIGRMKKTRKTKPESAE